jgi:hypothetical protein
MTTPAIAHSFPRPYARPAHASRTLERAGLVMSAIPSLFLAFDGAIKVVLIQPVVQGMTDLGYPVAVAPALGVVLLTCLALYLVPRTALLGAILLTGYLGGAVATHVRVGQPLFSHVLFPTYVGMLLWGGLYLRDARLRALVPFRSVA